MEIFISSWQHVLTVMFISMLPIVEVKGSIPFGVLTLGMPLVEVFIIAIIGSCVPAPIVLFYIKKIIHRMQSSSVKVFNKASNFLMSKVERVLLKFTQKTNLLKRVLTSKISLVLQVVSPVQISRTSLMKLQSLLQEMVD